MTAKDDVDVEMGRRRTKLIIYNAKSMFKVTL